MELRQKLAARGFEGAVVAAVVERLIGEKLLDDTRYVDNFVGLHAARGQGPLRVRAELRRLGLEGAIVEECLAAFPDWLPEAQRARHKKFGKVPPATAADKARQARFLGYRGFTSAQIRSALGLRLDLDPDSEGL